ncbi:response regulator transcription factor [Lederbergia lenta]|uniref:response regulator transcription factor n=1 Tax=Lederbergia lenta TaxID=1467 RepID=UPI0020413385|nr:response regulator transcription factor [Lederbergia lenta]MCM3111805.1 response regulator transcription factor [Lederbergia lenta]
MSDNEWCKVLIVDDEVLIRQGIKYYVNWEEEGFQIVGEAANGSEALELIEKTQPHIVITDIVMPIMDGEDLTKIIRKDYPDIQVIVLSSFSDFEYVRSTFQSGVTDYILKPKLEGAELLKALKKAANKLTGFQVLHKSYDDNLSPIDHILATIMSGFSEDIDEDIIKDTFQEKYYSILGISMTHKEDTNGQMVKDHVEQALNIHFGDIATYPLMKEDYDLAYILNFKLNKLPIIRRNMQELSTSLSGTIKGISLSLSEPYNAIKDTNKKYQESISTLKNCRFYFPDKSVFIYDELPAAPALKETFNLNRFIEVFKRGEFNESFLYLNDYVDYLSHQFTKDVHEFKSFIGNIIFNITVLLGNLHYDNKQLDKEKYQYFTSINEAVDIHETVGYLHSFLEEVNEVIISKMNDKSDTNIQKLLDYIDQHYAEPLNLTEMANHFHFNPSYLSSYFSTHHSVGFNEYLNRVRIEKAKDCLRSGKISISEISGMIGYSDHSYFCKVFKKMTGMSPSSYRKSFI